MNTALATASRLALAAAAALTLLLIAGRAAALDTPVRPTAISPGNGQVFTARTPIVFRALTVPDETNSLWLHVSTSPVTDAQGTLASDADIERFEPVPGQPGVFEAAPSWYSFSSFWMNTPGTYYWQVFRIDCYDPQGPSGDCHIESAVQSLTIVPRPVTARIVGLGPVRGCYVSGTRLGVSATGFAPGRPVDIAFSGRTAARVDADAAGNVSTTVTVPSAGYGPVQRRFTLTLTEREYPANTTARSILATNLAFTSTPSYFTRVGQRVQFRFSGMVPNRAVYAHYRLGGRTLANVRLGVARGACGLLTVRVPMIPAAIARRGTWTVQFDPLPRYSAVANPRIRRTIVVRTVFR